MSSKKYFIEIFEKNSAQDTTIDAVRALSVLSIILFHVVVGSIHIFESEKAKEYILDMPKVLQPLWHGEKGVDAFFLISALVLAMPIFKKTEKFNFKDAIAFYKKRFFRIYPLFVVALVLYTAGQWSYFGKYFFSNLFFVNNLIDGERTIIPVGWSLIVEVQYYFVLPALFYYISRSKFKLCALTTLAGLSFFFAMGILLKNEELYKRPLTDLFLSPDKGVFSEKMGRIFYEANLARFGPFSIGLLLAYLRVFEDSRLKSLFSNKIFTNTILIMAASFILLPVTLPLYHPDSWYYRVFLPEINLFVLSASRQIFAAGLALLMLGCWYGGGAFNKIKRVFDLSIWLPISRLSFPIYLFHFPFIAVAAAIVFQTTNIKDVASINPLEGAGIFILATTLTLLFSIPLHIYIERPFIERGKNRAN